MLPESFAVLKHIPSSACVRSHPLCFLGRGRAGAPEAPSLDLVLTTCLLCVQPCYNTVGVCSNACMQAGGGRWDLTVHACSAVYLLHSE
jgi:hypothetical protein